VETIGYAALQVIPSMKGATAGVESELNGTMSKAGASGGHKFAGALGSAVKKTVAGVAVAAGAVLTTSLFQGFNRLQAIEQATAKLDGLGHSAKTVDRIMGNALASVKGTAFGLGDASTIAASAVAAGIKPGHELTRTLALIGDAATIGGTSLSEMGAIFNKVATANSIQGDVINQLNDRGIPIVQLLGKTMGKTSAEVTALASKGQIDFKTFSKAMDSGLGGAALKSGNTVSGAFANMKASLGRIGAGLLGGVFKALPNGISGVTNALEPLESKATALGEVIGQKLTPVIEGMGPALTKVIAWVTNVDFSAFSTGAGSMGQMGGAVDKIGGALKGVDWSQLKDAFGEGVADTASVFAVAIGFVADHIDLLAKAMPALITAYAAYKAAQAVSNLLALASVPLNAALIVSNFALASANRALATQMAITNNAERVGLVTRLRSAVVTTATAVAQTVASVATRTWAAAQWLLNAAMTANPIGLVVVAIVALVAVFVIAYKKSETFRNIVNKAFTSIRDFVVSAVGTVVGFVRDNWRKILVFLTGPIGLAASQVAKHWDRISAGARGMYRGVRSAIGNVIDFVTGLPGRIVGALGDVKSTLTSAGGDLMRGLAGGIRDAAANVLSTIKSYVTDKIPKYVKKALGIASPSKVMRRLARWIPAGIAAGIRDGDEGISKALQTVTDTIAKESEKSLKAESDRIIAARRRQNAAIRKGNQNRGKKEKAHHLLPAITRAEADKIAKRNMKTIRSQSKAANALVKAQQKSTKAIWARGSDAGTDALVNSISVAGNIKKGSAAEKATLTDLAKARTVLAGRLEAAQGRLADAVALRDDFAKSIADGVRSYASLMHAEGQVNAYGFQMAVTSNDIVKTMQDRLNATLKFKSDMALLLSSGLNQSTYKELLEQGPEAAGAYAQALVNGGPAALTQVNSLTGQIESAAVGLGRDSSTALYQAGVDSAAGLVRGIESQIDKIEKASAKVAARLARAVKKALGIKSPSRVLAGLGRFAGLGLAQGVSDTGARVASAAGSLASTVAHSLESMPSLASFGGGVAQSFADGITGGARAVRNAVNGLGPKGGLNVVITPDVPVIRPPSLPPPPDDPDGGSGGGRVVIHQTNINPVAEPASKTTDKAARLIGQVATI
jgi:tape measure domain-containing protein